MASGESRTDAGRYIRRLLSLLQRNTACTERDAVQHEARQGQTRLGPARGFLPLTRIVPTSSSSPSDRRFDKRTGTWHITVSSLALCESAFEIR